MSILQLPEDILYKIYTYLSPIEADMLSKTCKTLNNLYSNLFQKTKTISMSNFINKDKFSETIKNEVEKGNRYVDIDYVMDNKKIKLRYKIVNITYFYDYGIKLILINYYYTSILKTKTLTILNTPDYITDIHLLQESKFQHQIRGIKA